MVAFLSFLQECEILIEHVFLRERDSIDARHHWACLIAAPVSGSTTEHFDSFDRFGRNQVRTSTEVGESTLCIGGDMSVLELRDEFAFICLSFRAELVKCVCFGDRLLAELLFLSAKFHHLGFDSREVRVLDGLSFGWHHIIVETILDSRTDTELDTGIELLQRLRHEVRRGVPKSMLSLSIVPLMQFDSTVGCEGLIEFHYLELLCVIVFDRSHKDILR